MSILSLKKIQKQKTQETKKEVVFEFNTHLDKNIFGQY